jgi:sugar lactone lactonase YvrE
MAETAGFKDAVGTNALFNQPGGLVADSAGTVYVADSGNGVLRKVMAGGSVSTPSLQLGTATPGTSSPTGASAGSANGATTVTSFVYPAGIARDTSGNLYVADSAGHAIVKMTSSGVVSLLAGSAGVAGMQDGTGTGALFNSPAGIAIDSSGNVYVADSGNGAIRKVSSSGIVTTLAGSTANRGYADGRGTAAMFNNPLGVAADAAGNVYVADTYNNSIRKIDSSGAVTTLAGSAATRGENDATGTAASFNCPTGVAVDSGGNVYVADSFNATIRKVTSRGAVTTLAGSAGVMGASNLSGINSLFNLPTALTIDNGGNVYVADSNNALIRKVTSGGTASTVAGNAGIAGYRDGTSTTALFSQPRGITVDGTGTVYVADTGNALIRKITSDGTVTTLPIKTAASSSGSAGGSVDTSPYAPSGGSGGSSGGSESSGSSGGGGGGAVEPWFVLALALLAVARRRFRSS